MFKGVGDVYVEDVMYHKNSLNRYIKKFQYDIDALMAFEVDDDRFLLEDPFKELTFSIKIETVHKKWSKSVQKREQEVLSFYT